MTNLDYIPLLPLTGAFWSASLVLVFVAIYGLLRYRNAFNPLLFFVITDGFFQTLLSAWLAFSALAYPAQDIANVLVLSTVYFFGTAVVFLPVRLVGVRVLIRHWLMRSKLMASQQIRGKRSQLLFIAITFVLVYLTLMVASGAGFLWITNPRMAYQDFRAGSGFLFLLAQWTLISGFLIYLFSRPQSLGSCLRGLAFYISTAYFTGSKGAMVSGLVLCGSFYNFYVRKIPVIWFLISILFCIPMMLALLVFQGSYLDVFEALNYFKDYVATSATFLSRFNEFGLSFGAASLSDFWFYVPRLFYPDKPFEYGVILIHQRLFPGMAELGHTPGISTWALAYLDFGTLGVFLSGILGGLVKRIVYESFLVRPYSIFAFVLMLQLTLMPVYIYANLPLSALIAFLLSWYLRKRISAFSG